MSPRSIPHWNEIPGKPSIGDLAGILPLDKLPPHTHSWNDLPGLLPADKLPLHNHDASYVPYTGASGSLNLGTHGLTTEQVRIPGAYLDFVPAGFGLNVRRTDNSAFQFGFSLSQGMLLANGFGLGWANSADSAPNARIMRNPTGPTLETWSAGGLKVCNADGSALGALQAGQGTFNQGTGNASLIAQNQGNSGPNAAFQAGTPFVGLHVSGVNYVTTMVAGNAASVPLTIKGATGHTASLIEWQNNTGTILGTITNAGALQASGATFKNPLQGGLVIRECEPSNGGWSNFELTGPNFALGAGLKFVNHNTTIQAGSNFTAPVVGSPMGNFGGTGNPTASEDSVRIGASGGQGYIYSMRYAGNPYPELNISGQVLRLKTGGGAWPAASGGGGYGTTALTIDANQSVTHSSGIILSGPANNGTLSLGDRSYYGGTAVSANLYGVTIKRHSWNGVKFVDLIEQGTGLVQIGSHNSDTVEINNGVTGTLRDFRARGATFTGTLNLSNPLGPTVSLTYAGSDRSGGLVLNGGRISAYGNAIRPGFDVADHVLDGASPDFGSYNSNGTVQYFGLHKKAGSPGVMQVRHTSTTWANLEAGNATLTGAGPTLFLNRSGMSSFSLGDANGDSFRIQNANASTDLMRIHQATRETTLYGALVFKPKSSTVAPNTSDVPSGCSVWWHDTVGNTRRFAYNDAGTMHISPLLKATIPAAPTTLSEVISVLQHWGLCA